MNLTGATRRGRMTFRLPVGFGREHVECSDRLPCNELSRHKAVVDPFAPLRISSVNFHSLAAAAAPLPSGDMLRGVWTHVSTIDLFHVSLA